MYQLTQGFEDFALGYGYFAPLVLRKWKWEKEMRRRGWGEVAVRQRGRIHVAQLIVEPIHIHGLVVIIAAELTFGALAR